MLRFASPCVLLLLSLSVGATTVAHVGEAKQARSVSMLALARTAIPEGARAWDNASALIALSGGCGVALLDADGSIRASWCEDLATGTRVLRPVDVAVSGEHVLLLDRFQRRVVTLRLDADRFEFTGTHALPFTRDPEAIDVSVDGRVVILDAGLNVLFVLAPDFSLERRIGEGGRGPMAMNCPHDIFATPEGVVYVADAGNRRIQRYRLDDGRGLGPWGAHGEGPDRFLDPTGVAILADGNLVVADHYAHRLVVYDADTGREIIERRLDLPEHIRYPGRIAVLDNNKCVVTCPQPSEVWVMECP